jgi:hypothetical protein
MDAPELSGPAVERIILETGEAQAEAIVQQVHQWVFVEGINPTDVAVLIAKRPKAMWYELLQQQSRGRGVH